MLLPCLDCARPKMTVAGMVEAILLGLELEVSGRWPWQRGQTPDPKL